jgi:hypothetical protein
MARYYRKKTSVRSEQERGLRIKTTHRRTPDLEMIARVIVGLALDDPLGLATSQQAEISMR